MIRWQPPFSGKRFIGDTATNIVHDALYELTYTSPVACDLSTLKLDCVRTFFPDSLEQAKLEGYKPCKNCLFLENPIT